MLLLDVIRGTCKVLVNRINDSSLAVTICFLDCLCLTYPEVEGQLVLFEGSDIAWILHRDL